jgi:Zn-dependent protease
MSSRELQDLTVAWLVLSFCFSLGWMRGGLGAFMIWFVIASVAVGANFIFHELAHKFVAQRFGYWAEFRLWPTGILFALIFSVMTFGSVVFAAPGAVYIVPPPFRPFYPARDVTYESGVIALAGPLVNVGLAFGFFSLMLTGSYFLFELGRYGLFISLFLASFNMLPLGPLDGRKVFAWSPLYWGAFSIPVWACTLSIMMG